MRSAAPLPPISKMCKPISRASSCNCWCSSTHHAANLGCVLARDPRHVLLLGKQCWVAHPVELEKVLL